MADLTKNLKFVQGAVKANKLRPELEHYQIKNGLIVGYNGHMALGAPIELDLEAQPKASLFFRALEACGDAISLEMTPNGRLNIRSGPFSAYIPCVDIPIYEARPEGELFAAPVGFGAVCRKLLPMISDDASRRWAMGVCWDQGSLMATNNLIIIQQWLGGELPKFHCPKYAIAEVARVGMDPEAIQISPSSITFHFSDGRWIRAQQSEDQWPHELIHNLLNKPTNPQPIPEGMFKGLLTLAAFVPDETSAVRFKQDRIETGDGEAGASIHIPGIPEGPIFARPILSLLEGVAHQIDFSQYPSPCGFYGDNCRGVILGMRG